MKLLMIGDVVSTPGCAAVRRILPDLKKQYNIDVVIANAENSANGNGISPDSATSLFQSGCDVLTGGNHTLKRRQIYTQLEQNPNLLRPANFPFCCPGSGLLVYDLGWTSITVINLVGQVFMEANNSPFDAASQLLKDVSTPVIIVDFHAEATGEKGALAYYLDGKVSAVLGTHTHVQTNDARVLPKGTGFISDVGMTGPIDSILGVSAACIVRKMTTHLPTKFEVPDTLCCFNAVLLEVDKTTGKCAFIKTININ